MKKIRKWHGNIGTLMQEHIALRESMGLSVVHETGVLDQLNCFMREQYPKLKAPNRFSILHFLHTKKDLMLSGRKNILVHIRQFCRFLNQRGIPCYVPDKTLLPRLRYKPRYFPLSAGDVENLMAGMKTVRRNHPFVGQTYATLVGLLWCTGMRRSESVNLKHRDIDFKENTILVRETKFYKKRMIPIDESVAKELLQYVEKKKQEKYPIEEDAPFFVNLDGTKVKGQNLCNTFRRVVERIGLVREKKRPVIHDLRHNFATHALRRFYSTDAYPTQTLLNILATYLGHSDMLYSQYYLHPDFDLLMKASTRFAAGRKAA